MIDLLVKPQSINTILIFGFWSGNVWYVDFINSLQFYMRKSM